MMMMQSKSMQSNQLQSHKTLIKWPSLPSYFFVRYSIKRRIILNAVLLIVISLSQSVSSEEVCRYYPYRNNYKSYNVSCSGVCCTGMATRPESACCTAVEWNMGAYMSLAIPIFCCLATCLSLCFYCNTHNPDSQSRCGKFFGRRRQISDEPQDYNQNPSLSVKDDPPTYNELYQNQQQQQTTSGDGGDPSTITTNTNNDESTSSSLQVQDVTQLDSSNSNPTNSEEPSTSTNAATSPPEPKELTLTTKDLRAEAIKSPAPPPYVTVQPPSRKLQRHLCRLMNATRAIRTNNPDNSLPSDSIANTETTITETASTSNERV